MRRLRDVAVVVCGLAVIAMGSIGVPVPASALSQSERFVHAVYEDYLDRGATDPEIVWWTTYLGSNSRSSMVANVLASEEFMGVWVLAASHYYIDGVDPAIAGITSTLVATGDFVESEVSLVAGATYFSSNGGTNSTFVEAVYEDVLLRSPDGPGLAYWVGRLDAATSTRSNVARSFIRTTEASTRRVAGVPGLTACPATDLTHPDSLQSGSYCLVLDRIADAPGISYWVAQLSGTDQLPSLWTSMSASLEYWGNAGVRDFPH